MEKVEFSESGCWDWTGAKVKDGYSRIGYEGRSQPGHRVSYRIFVGEIPEGWTIDHLCRNRGCVNPEHLEPTTWNENKRRGFAPPACNARKGECVNGHPFDEANTYTYPSGVRGCRICRRNLTRKYRGLAPIEG